MQKVKRVILNIDEVRELLFDNKSSKFLVKNLSDNDLLVSFDDQMAEDEWMKIPAGDYQVCMIMEMPNLKVSDWVIDKTMWIDKLYLKGSGEVEVQLLTWE